MSEPNDQVEHQAVLDHILKAGHREFVRNARFNVTTRLEFHADILCY